MTETGGKGTIELVHGRLKGMGREAPCELLARKRSLPAGKQFGVRRYEYSQFSIVRAPADYPDGGYTLLTEDGQELPVTNTRGLWMLEAEESQSEECA